MSQVKKQRTSQSPFLAWFDIQRNGATERFICRVKGCTHTPFTTRSTSNFKKHLKTVHRIDGETMTVSENRERLRDHIDVDLSTGNDTDTSSSTAPSLSLSAGLHLQSVITSENQRRSHSQPTSFPIPLLSTSTGSVTDSPRGPHRVRSNSVCILRWRT